MKVRRKVRLSQVQVQIKQNADRIILEFTVADLTAGDPFIRFIRLEINARHGRGSRRIADHMRAQGLRIDSVNAIGGISKKAPFVMQTLADVMNMPIRVIRSEQACALGAAMFAAVAAGVYANVSDAIRHMGSDVEAEYVPDPKRVEVYDGLYKKYLKLAGLSDEIS